MIPLKEIRLDKNELPFTPPLSIQDAIKDIHEELHRYTPQEKVNELKDLLSEYTNVPKDSIIIRPGSDILIKELIFLFTQNRKMIISDPTFSVIQNATRKTSSSILKVKLSSPEFHFPTEIIQEELNEPTLIFLDNPNNPTGKLIITKEEIKSLLDNENVVLFIDEAYYEFSNYSVASLVKRYSNLGVLRTLSKSFGIAGAGSGYLLAGEDIKDKLSGLEVMLPYPSVESSIVALQNQTYFKDLRKQIIAEKSRIKNRIEALGINVYSSSTNFLLLNTKIPYIAKKLQERGIYIYDASNYFKPGYIRVSIGTKEENESFITNLKEIIEE